MKYGYISSYGNFYQCQKYKHNDINRELHDHYNKLKKSQIQDILQVQLQFRLLYNYNFLKITNDYQGDILVYLKRLTRNQYNTLIKLYGKEKVFYVDGKRYTTQELQSLVSIE